LVGPEYHRPSNSMAWAKYGEDYIWWRSVASMHSMSTWIAYPEAACQALSNDTRNVRFDSCKAPKPLPNWSHYWFPEINMYVYAIP